MPEDRAWPINNKWVCHAQKLAYAWHMMPRERLNADGNASGMPDIKNCWPSTVADYAGAWVLVPPLGNARRGLRLFEKYEHFLGPSDRIPRIS